MVLKARTGWVRRYRTADLNIDLLAQIDQQLIAYPCEPRMTRIVSVFRTGRKYMCGVVASQTG